MKLKSLIFYLAFLVSGPAVAADVLPMSIPFETKLGCDASGAGKTRSTCDVASVNGWNYRTASGFMLDFQNKAGVLYFKEGDYFVIDLSNATDSQALFAVNFLMQVATTRSNFGLFKDAASGKFIYWLSF